MKNMYKKANYGFKTWDNHEIKSFIEEKEEVPFYLVILLATATFISSILFPIQTIIILLLLFIIAS